MPWEAASRLRRGPMEGMREARFTGTAGACFRLFGRPVSTSGSRFSRRNYRATAKRACGVMRIERWPVRDLPHGRHARHPARTNWRAVNMATRNSTTATSRSGAKSQIVAALKDDHKKVRKAFRDFEKLDPEQDLQAAQALVEHTCAEIEVHAELEEQFFYPAARKATKDEDLLEEAEVEHMSAKVLIEQIKGLNPGEPKYAASFKVLGEYIDHHATEEEKEMFPSLTKPGVDWDSVLEQMNARREELKEEKGVAELEQRMLEQTESASGSRPGSARRGSTRSAAEARPQAASRKSKKSRDES
jgi:hypothetical protein